MKAFFVKWHGLAVCFHESRRHCVYSLVAEEEATRFESVGEATAACKNYNLIGSAVEISVQITTKPRRKDKMAKEKQQIVVLDRGFVYVGNVSIKGETMTITNARNIRRWGTTAGLGELANNGPTPNTKLDVVGIVTAPMRAVIHSIECATTW